MVADLDTFNCQTIIYKKAKNPGGITPLVSGVFLPCLSTPPAKQRSAAANASINNKHPLLYAHLNNFAPGCYPTTHIKDFSISAAVTTC